MQPVPHITGIIAGAATLGSFVFVMRKGEVRAAAVNVDGIAQMFFHHGRAFDMPTGPSTPPGAIPTGLACSRGLPQYKVFRIFFVSGYFDPSTVDHIFQ